MGSATRTKKEHVEYMKTKAEIKTKKALEELNKYRNLLIDGVKPTSFEWDKLYDNIVFEEKPPMKDNFLQKANIPKESIWEIFFTSMREERIRKIQEVEYQYQLALAEFEKREISFQNQVNEANRDVKHLKKEFEEGVPSAIEHIAKLTLDYSEYPKHISKEYQFHFDRNTQILVVNFELPSPEKLPSTVEFKYVQTRQEIISKEMKAKEHQLLYGLQIQKWTMSLIDLNYPIISSSSG